MAKLTTIEGIGPSIAGKFKKAGVGSCTALLEAGGTGAGRRELAARTGMDDGRILKFVNHADLMRVKGVGGEYAELLEAAGVDTVPELANRNAANLARKMADVNRAKRLVRAVPSEKRVTGWVGQAKRLKRAVSY